MLRGRIRSPSASPLTDDPRVRRVLEAVRAMSDWHTPREIGHGLVWPAPSTTALTSLRSRRSASHRAVRCTWSACGARSMPGAWCIQDGARNQIEGGVQQAASWTLLEELKVRDGVVISSSWRDYPIATFLDAPRAIEVRFVGDPDVASTGVGEPGSVPTAGAIANAVFAACGRRIRRLPIAPALRLTPFQ